MRSPDHDFEVRLSRKNESAFSTNQKVIVASQVVKLTIPVPRCATCAAIHRWAKKVRRIIYVIWIGIGILMLAVVLALILPLLERSAALSSPDGSGDVVGFLIAYVLWFTLIGLVWAAAEITFRAYINQRHADDFRDEIRLPTKRTLSTLPGKVRTHVNEGYQVLMGETRKLNTNR
jgi:hypothetical protein